MSLNKIDKLLDQYDQTKNKFKEFSDLLTSIESIEDKKKMLWKEIYHNAILDRENAAILFTDAFKQMQNGTTEHITLGPVLSKYLERMCKSNDQILRLAELIAKSENSANKTDPADIFSKIKD